MRAAWGWVVSTESERDEVVHGCPDEGETVMPCCGRTPFEVPRWHRMTLDKELVTCGR